MSTLKIDKKRNNRYKKVIQLRNAKTTFQEIGDLIGVTRQRAHQIYQDAMNDGVPVKKRVSKIKKTRRNRLA